MVESVLVSGASVAGLTAAYWLQRNGYAVTVVERYPGLRPGGQAIDVRGPALEVLDRMGLRAAAEDCKTRIRGSSVVDQDGNELSEDTESTPTGGPINNPDIELLRDDLVGLLYDETKLKTEFLFDDSIDTLENLGPAVNVTFENSDPRSFDLVVGADGLHSQVRRLVFGPEERFIKRLGTFAAIFTVRISWTWTTGRNGITATPAWPGSTVRAATPRRGPCWGSWTPNCELTTATPKLSSTSWNGGWLTTAGSAAAAGVHAVGAGFLLRRDVADRDGPLVNRPGCSGGRRRILRLAALRPRHQLGAARCDGPGGRTQTGPAPITGSDSRTISSVFTPTPNAPSSWPATAFPAARRSPRSSSTSSSTRSRC